MKAKFFTLALMLPTMAVCQKKTVNLYSECYKTEYGQLVRIGCDTAFKLDKFFVANSTFSYTPTIDTVWKNGTTYYYQNRISKSITSIASPKPPDWWSLKDIDTTIYKVGDTLRLTPSITDSQFKTAILLSQGKAAWEIAKEMKITSTVVYGYIGELKLLFGAKNDANLIYIMTKNGML